MRRGAVSRHGTGRRRPCLPLPDVPKGGGKFLCGACRRAETRSDVDAGGTCDLGKFGWDRPGFLRHLRHAAVLSLPRRGACVALYRDLQSGAEGLLPQVAELAHIKRTGTTEEDMPDEVVGIAVSNRQHPDHDTESWPT